MKVIDRTKTVTEHFLENSFKKLSLKKKNSERHKNIVFVNVCCVMMLCFCVVQCVSFWTGHFVMVPLNLTYLHCLQHSLFEHLFNLYCFNVDVLFTGASRTVLINRCILTSYTYLNFIEYQVKCMCFPTNQVRNCAIYRLVPLCAFRIQLTV